MVLGQVKNLSRGFGRDFAEWGLPRRGSKTPHGPWPRNRPQGHAGPLKNCLRRSSCQHNHVGSAGILSAEKQGFRVCHETARTSLNISRWHTDLDQIGARPGAAAPSRGPCRAANIGRDRCLLTPMHLSVHDRASQTRARSQSTAQDVRHRPGSGPFAWLISGCNMSLLALVWLLVLGPCYAQPLDAFLKTEDGSDVPYAVVPGFSRWSAPRHLFTSSVIIVECSGRKVRTARVAL